MPANDCQVTVREVVERLGHRRPGVSDDSAVSGSRRADIQHSCDAARATTSAIGVTIIELPK